MIYHTHTYGKKGDRDFYTTRTLRGNHDVPDHEGILRSSAFKTIGGQGQTQRKFNDIDE